MKYFVYFFVGFIILSSAVTLYNATSARQSPKVQKTVEFKKQASSWKKDIVSTPVVEEAPRQATAVEAVPAAREQSPAAASQTIAQAEAGKSAPAETPRKTAAVTSSPAKSKSYTGPKNIAAVEAGHITLMEWLNTDPHEGSVLASHPVPQYTDFSGLNANLADLEPSYRQREFRAYKPLADLHKQLKISNYSSLENPTGIWFAEGEKIRVRMEGIPDSPVRFKIVDLRDSHKEKSYELKPGQNEWVAEHDGLAYIDYRNSYPSEASPIQLKIEGGQINGVFTRHDSVEVWRHLLSKAKFGMFDILGERCQWLLYTDSLRKHCADMGPEFLRLHDRLICLQQRILGWDWEGIHPGNHVMGRSMMGGYMHADGLGAAFVKDVLPEILNVRACGDNRWGVAHEFGHVNQTHPGMMWTGTTETTVNIFSALMYLDFSSSFSRMEHQWCSTLEGHHMRGACFDNFVNSALVNRELWQYHRGSDDDARALGKKCGDSLVLLCPFWQMYLYNTLARGNELFYPRVFKSVRDTDERSMPAGELRMKYLDRCCDAAKLDFSDYFLETGMLAVMNRYVDDYYSSWMTITEDMCRNALKHARQYPKPDTQTMFYITTNTVHIYRDRMPVVPSPGYIPKFSLEYGKSFVIPADRWANAVAFEVYNKKKLMRICLRGLGHKDNSSTTVIIPEGATAVVAVQWDGTRYTIYSKTGEKIDGKPDSWPGPGTRSAYISQQKSRKK